MSVVSRAGLVARGDQLPGYAIGGLAGGEDKHSFWKVVEQCTAGLPEVRGGPLGSICLAASVRHTSLYSPLSIRILKHRLALSFPQSKPRYVMGVGYPLDIVVRPTFNLCLLPRLSVRQLWCKYAQRASPVHRCAAALGRTCTIVSIRHGQLVLARLSSQRRAGHAAHPAYAYLIIIVSCGPSDLANTRPAGCVEAQGCMLCQRLQTHRPHMHVCGL